MGSNCCMNMNMNMNTIFNPLSPAAAVACSRSLRMSSFSSSSSSSFNLLVHRKCPILCKAQGATNEVVALTDSKWDSLVVGSSRPVLVEFWAPWCGPCRMIAPVIDELAKEYSGKLACYKVNTDDCPGIATQCGIRSIPTVLLFNNGEKKESVIGAVPKSTLTATINNRQGKVRLTKWYSPYTQKERTKVIRELCGVIVTRGPKLCNFIEWRALTVVYRRYAGLYFCMCVDQEDNQLEILAIIHHYVEILDRYFGNVCELDLIFNFHKAYYILDELLLAGELQETSKKIVARLISTQDGLVEAAKEQSGSISHMLSQASK